MKFATLFSVLAVAAATVGVTAYETNAERLARGLPPNPPSRRGPTRVVAARRGYPSGHPGGNCNVEKIQCCNSVTHSSDKNAQKLAGLLGVVLGADVAVGITCHPLSLIGLGGNGCNAQPVCCQNNNFNGLIAVGCSPININA